MSELNLRPGLSLGSYPQKQPGELTELEQNVARFFKRLKKRFTDRSHSQKYIAHKVNQYQQAMQESSEEQLTQTIRQLRNDLHRKGLKKALIFKTFAVIREAASRTLGKSHYDVQLFGGWLMINGMLAEMETGEGKTTIPDAGPLPP